MYLTPETEELIVIVPSTPLLTVLPDIVNVVSGASITDNVNGSDVLLQASLVTSKVYVAPSSADVTSLNVNVLPLVVVVPSSQIYEATVSSAVSIISSPSQTFVSPENVTVGDKETLITFDAAHPSLETVNV